MDLLLRTFIIGFYNKRSTSSCRSSSQYTYHLLRRDGSSCLQKCREEIRVLFQTHYHGSPIRWYHFVSGCVIFSQYYSSFSAQYDNKVEQEIDDYLCKYYSNEADGSSSSDTDSTDGSASEDEVSTYDTKAVMYPNILDKLCYTSFLFSYCMHWTNMDMHTSMPVVHASTTNMHWTNILYALDGQNWYV